jgi:hypothetical protein
MFPRRRLEYTATIYWIIAGLLYALAKVVRFTDQAIYFDRRLVQRTFVDAPSSRVMRSSR